MNEATKSCTSPKSEWVFEQGPIRPPSEQRSLLVRINRGCPWNRCLFCPVHKGERFSARTADEVMEDLDAMRRHLDVIESGELPLFMDPQAFLRNRQVAAWWQEGGRTVFLQDANPLVMPVDDLATVLSGIGTRFPSVERITTYGKLDTIARVGREGLTRLREAGLTRIHTGLESGSAEVLELIAKGITPEDALSATEAVKAAGLELSVYVIPGLGGKALSERHADETAAIVSRMAPDFVRLRSLAVSDGSRLDTMVREGTFEPLCDEGIAQEIGRFLGNLHVTEGTLVSDHVLNLFEEIGGELPGARDDGIALINRFFDEEPLVRRMYILGRRMLWLRSLSDLDDPAISGKLRALVDKLETMGPKAFDATIRKLMGQFV